MLYYVWIVYVWIVFIVWLYLLYVLDLLCVLCLLCGVHAAREPFDSSFGWFASGVNLCVNICNKIFAKQFVDCSC